MQPLLTGVFAERYRIDSVLGSGGMAVVYRSRDLKHDRDVALKVLRPELTSSIGAERFQREIGVAAKLTHPNILTLHDSGEQQGVLFYVTPLIEGESLRQRLERESPLTIGGAVAIARGIASALECAHASHVVHRDIKPENVLLAAGQPVVADFGLAHVFQAGGSERLTATGIIVGTPAYMSPEQAAGELPIDARTDIYSLGCVLYEMLTGSPPFCGPSVRTVMARRILEAAPDVRNARDNVPEPLAALVASMLACAAADRPQTATDLVQALTALESEYGDFSGATAIRWRTAARRARARTHTRLAATAMGVAAMLGAMWFARDHIPLLREAFGGSAIKTLAVLPLQNLSGDVKQEFLADGLTESLISDLARLQGVRVISRTSVMQYKLLRKPAREIARELKADALVEGSLTTQGDRVRVTAKLIRGADDRSLWTASYDGQLGELFDLQARVGAAVAREIGARIAPRSKAGVKRAAVKPESQQAHLKGLYYAAQWRLVEAIASFQKAVGLDSENAPAYAALARAYYFRAFFGEIAPLEAFSQMRRAAQSALQRDADLAEAHALMALVATHFDWDWPAAEAHFSRALELSPNNAQVHHDYAHFLLAVGRGPQSVESSRRSVELDPANPMLTSCLGWHSLFDLKFDESAQYANEAQRLMPSFWAQIVLGWSHVGKEAKNDAIEAMRSAVDLSSDLPFARAALGHVLGRYGERREAQNLLARLLVDSNKGYVSAYDIAVVYAGLGDREQALEWLGKALAERSMFVVHLRWDARLDPLRSDQRFTDLVTRLGIPTAPTRRTAAKS